MNMNVNIERHEHHHLLLHRVGSRRRHLLLDELRDAHQDGRDVVADRGSTDP